MRASTVSNVGPGYKYFRWFALGCDQCANEVLHHQADHWGDVRPEPAGIGRLFIQSERRKSFKQCAGLQCDLIDCLCTDFCVFLWREDWHFGCRGDTTGHTGPISM
ncbi:hypothetical protein SprV_0501830500 [Sparganum proliferum]